MQNVLPDPHGESDLIDRFVRESDSEAFIQNLSTCKAYTISEADLSVLYRIADGALSPLEGPMNSEQFHQVLEHESFSAGGKQHLWTIPIAFPISKEDADALEIGETIAIRHPSGNVIGSLEISDIYYFDKAKYNRLVYLTERTDHPGPRIFNEDPRDYLLGGKIRALPQPKHPVYGKYMLTPRETRSLFKERKWQRIVAFQTRNALHRAHEYAIVYAMETLTKKGYFTGAVINALVGATKSDDVPADVRMETYEMLLKQNLIGNGDKDSDFWQSKVYELNDQLLLIGLDMKMFYAGPKEAIMHAIYRQNYGFTDIIIGRKHADAPFDDGAPVWGDFDAQLKFENLDGKLLIKSLNVGFAAYFEEIARVGLVEEFKAKGFSQVSISGKELRQKLQNGESVDERIMRKPVAEVLSLYYKKTGVKSKNITWHESDISKKQREQRNGHKGIVLWLTGLSGSGKSTIAIELQSRLFEMGCSVFILDGDNIRHGLNRDLGFSPEDREENIRRIGEVARLFAEGGTIIITSFISPYRKDRDTARSLMPEGEFFEIFVKAPLEVCEKRDPKGLYEKARRGIIKEFTGISAPYEIPEKPELILETDKLTVEQSADTIINHLKTAEILSNPNC
ncbi:adenylyl-sulfate kinase [candidate division KSB1 bacterium]|nr:adenylyl-sulfate kinase [candidate division KSB1 bacterium]